MFFFPSFIANRSLDPKSGTFIDLLPSTGNAKSKPTGNVKYVVTVKTGSGSGGDNKSIGAESGALLSLYGSKGTVESVKLNSKSSSSKGLFERGRVDEFQFEGKDIGKVNTNTKTLLKKHSTIFINPNN